MTRRHEECWHECPVCGRQHAHAADRTKLLDEYWKPCSRWCEVVWRERLAARAARSARRAEYLREEAAYDLRAQQGL